MKKKNIKKESIISCIYICIYIYLYMYIYIYLYMYIRDPFSENKK